MLRDEQIEERNQGLFMKNGTLKKWTAAMLVALLTISLFAIPAFAADGDGASIMGTAKTKVANVFQSVKTITFIIGGFGLVGIAYQAIIGKVKWSWFAGLAVGLALLAAAGAIVEYATGTGSTAGQFGDTFGKGSGWNTVAN